MRIKKGNSAGQRYVRPRLAGKKFRLAQGMGQTLYLYGITGIGKTALVKDMLKQKSYDYYPVKEITAGEIEIPDAGKDCIVVIDDLHEVSGERQREEYAKKLKGLSGQENVWLILISRCKIPQWIMPFHVEDTFLIIREEDLLLDRVGQDAYFAKWDLEISVEAAEQIWQKGRGNPLFLKFIAQAGGSVAQAVSDMWSYLYYVFDQWDGELQEFLMEMSVVERFDVPMVQMVTGKRDAQRMIRLASETGNFLKEKDGMFEFNRIITGPYKAFLEKKFSAQQLARVYYNAGRMYEMYGDVLNALKMYEEGGDRKSIFRLLVDNARKNPAAGHYFELRRYYFMLPEEDISASPVLMAGMSMLQSMLMNIGESERWYQKLEQFAVQNGGGARREAKSRLLYLDIGLPHRGTVKMEDLIKHAGVLLKGGKAALPEFSVTSNLPSLMNGGKDFCEWSRRDKELAASIGKVTEFVLGRYGKGLVSLALAESYFEKGEDSYGISALAEKGRMQAEAGGKTELIFVAVGLLFWLAVVNGRAEDAGDILESFRQKAKKDAPQLLPNVSALRCRGFLYQGKLLRVQEWMDEAPDENKDFCSLDRLRYLTKVRGYIQFGRYEKAYGLLQKMRYYAETQKRDYIAMEILLLLAVVKYRKGEEEWQSLFQECVTRAEDYGFVRLLSREGGCVLKLIRAGDIAWKSEQFKRQAIRECEQMERFYPSYLKEKADGEIALSPNALDILRLQAEGYRTEQIAKFLDISVNTIKYHNKETYRKLGVSSRAAAVSEAKNRGLI